MNKKDPLKEINERILRNLFHSDRPQDSKRILMFLLRGLKEEYALSILLDDVVVEKLIFILDYAEDDQEKAEIINSILNIMYDIEYDFGNHKNEIEILLKSYLKIMDSGYYIIKDIKDTLFLFSELGVEKDYLIYEVAKRYKKKQCMEIFSILGFDLKGMDIPEHPDLYDFMERERKLSKRFGLIFHFYLMTEKDYVEHIEIAGTYFKMYHTHMTTCADWAFSSEQCFQHSYVKDGILSEEEEAIFIEMGDIYYDCISDIETSVSEEGMGMDSEGADCKEDLEGVQQEDFDKELDELFERLSLAADKFAVQLRTQKVQDLLKRFFKGKTLFEVAFCLPNE